MTPLAPLPRGPSSPTVMHAVLPYPPACNNLTAVVRGRKIKSAAGRQYAEVAAAWAREAGMRPLDGPVSVTLRVFRPRRCGDLDNVFKAPLDALKGVAWGDDKQIVELHAYRDEDKHDPRVEVTVSPAGPAGAVSGRAE